MSEGVKSLRLVAYGGAWAFLSMTWKYHGQILEERFVVGMN